MSTRSPAIEDVERGAQEPNGAGPALLGEDRHFIQRNLQGPQQLVLIPYTGVCGLVGSRLGAGGDDLVRPEPLELDVVGACLGGDRHHLPRSTRIAVVIDPGFGDNQWRIHQECQLHSQSHV